MRREEPSAKKAPPGPESDSSDHGPVGASEEPRCPLSCGESDLQAGGGEAEEKTVDGSNPGAPLPLAVVPIIDPASGLALVDSLRLTIAFQTPMARS